MPTGLVARWLLLPLALMSLATASELLPNVTGDVTLTTAGSPWVVNETVYVEETGSLTVQPGVTVLMASGASLMVYGQLIAEGTSTDRIQFTLLDTRNTTEGKLKSVTLAIVSNQVCFVYITKTVRTACLSYNLIRWLSNNPIKCDICS